MSDNPWVATRVFDTTDTGAPTNGGGLGEQLLIAYGQQTVHEHEVAGPEASSTEAEGHQQDADRDLDVVVIEDSGSIEHAPSETEDESQNGDDDLHAAEVTTNLSDLASEVFGVTEPWIPTPADLEAMRSGETTEGLDKLIESTEGDYKLPKKKPAKKTAAPRKKKPTSSK